MAESRARTWVILQSYGRLFLSLLKAPCFFIKNFQFYGISIRLVLQIIGLKNADIPSANEFDYKEKWNFLARS